MHAKVTRFTVLFTVAPQVFHFLYGSYIRHTLPSSYCTTHYAALFKHHSWCHS